MKTSFTEAILEITRWFDGEYRVYVEDRQLYEKLKRRKDCRPHGEYLYPDKSKTWDLIVTADEIESVRKLVAKAKKSVSAKTRARTNNPPANRGLSDKELRGPESPLSDSKSV